MQNITKKHLDKNLAKLITQYVLEHDVKVYKRLYAGHVLNTVKKMTETETPAQKCHGFLVSDILNALGTEADKKWVQVSLDWLASEGLVYTTVDDNHYRASE